MRRNQSSDSRKHKYPFFPYVFFQSFPKVGELCAYTTCILNLWEYYVKKPNENTQQPSGHVLLLFPSRSRVSFFPLSLSLSCTRENLLKAEQCGSLTVKAQATFSRKNICGYLGFTRGCFSFLLFYFFFGGGLQAAESCEKGTRHGPLSSRTRSFLFACHCTCVQACVCLVCTALCRMRMVRLAPVIARIPGVGVLGGRGTKGHEMTLQIQLLAFHLPRTATWRGAAPGIPPPTRHTANARPRRDNLRGGGGGDAAAEKEPGNNLLL